MPTPEQEFSTLTEITQFDDLNSDDIFLGQDANQVPFKIKNQNFLSCNQVLCVTSAIYSQAQILLLNTAPQQLVVAAGAGKAIWVVEAFVNEVFDVGAFATNTKLIIGNTGGEEQLRSQTLNYSVNRIALFEKQGTPPAGVNQLIANTDLELSVESGDPTGGGANSTIQVTAYYYIVNI